MKKLLIIVFIGIILGAVLALFFKSKQDALEYSTEDLSDPAPALSPELLFKSGFEEEVILDPPRAPYEGVSQNLSGVDKSTGFSWDNLNGNFLYMVHKDDPLENYIETEILKMPGPPGSSADNNVLGMKVNQYYDYGPGWGHARNQYNLRIPDAYARQLYARYWIQFQPDLEIVSQPEGELHWRIFQEWRRSAPNDNFRWTVSVSRNHWVDEDDRLHWHFEIHDMDTNKKTTMTNRSVPVPVGTWALLETFWRVSDKEDGHILMKIDGQTIFDRKGVNSIDDIPWRTWNLFKVYTGKNTLKNGPTEQWIDDVEIWSALPPS